MLKKTNKLIQSGYLGKNVKEDCFVSPVVINVKKDQSVINALDSRKLNDSCKKLRTHMPNIEEFLNLISTETTTLHNKPLWISKINLQYAYGQLKISEEARRHCDFAKTEGNINGYYRFLKKGLDRH